VERHLKFNTAMQQSDDTGQVGTVLAEYYDELGWDTGLGMPTKKRIREVGLRDIAEVLERDGHLG
jgi:aldehyde:ferredoxin oxidoreductase